MRVVVGGAGVAALEAAAALRRLAADRVRVTLVAPDRTFSPARCPSSDLQPAPASGGGLHREVQVGREPGVEAKLLVTHRTAAGRRSVVQEVQDDRLFELVGTVADEEHPRDVNLAHLRQPGRRPRPQRIAQPLRIGGAPIGWDSHAHRLTVGVRRTRGVGMTPGPRP